MAARMVYRLHRRRIIRRQRIFRDRTNPLDLYDDAELFARFRFPRQELLDLCDLLEEDLRHPYHRQGSLPAVTQLMIALRFFVSPSCFHLIIADLFGVSRRTVGRVIKRVSYTLSDRLPEFVRLPQTEEDAQQIVRDFHNIAGFPNVIGCVDCTHIQIQAPTENEWEYVNRKNKHTINCQLMCDANMLIIQCVVRWPGSTHDSKIMKNSQLFRTMEAIPRAPHLRGKVILGDSGYQQNEWLMTPYRDPQTRQQRNYQQSHVTTRSTIERVNGVLKRRWHCLHSELRYQPLPAMKVIEACICLHNVARTLGLPDPDSDYEDEDGDEPQGQNNQHAQQDPQPTLAGRLAREQFVRQYFTD